MIQRTLKRTLSIFLALVLIATTFFIFDPSTLKLDAKAWLSTESNTLGSSLPAQAANAPETIYLKPGSSNFQYFSLINNENGTAGNSKSTTGSVTFSNGNAESIRLYVNNLWVKSAPGGSFSDASNQLTLNGATASPKRSITASTSTETSGPVASTNNQSSLTYSIAPNTSSLANAVEGNVYMIEWAVGYKLKGETDWRYIFMYTGVYVPRLTITGSAGMGYYTGTGNTPCASTFAFITGAMGYYAGSNGTAKYVNKTAGVNAAPLVQFVGQKNNSSSYSIPNTSGGGNENDSYYNHMTESFNFPDGTTGTIQVNGKTNDEYPRYATYYTSLGNYLNMAPVGSNCSDCASGAGYSGVAYEVVDTSRFTNFNQIPNLSAGFVRYYADEGGHAAFLDKIVSVNGSGGGDTYASTPTINISCAVDRAEYDEDGNNSRTWGLYPFNGTPKTANTVMNFEYHQGINLIVGSRTAKIQHGVGFSIMAVDKDAIRKAYAEGLLSNIDRKNDSSFATHYTDMKTQAMKLCDPTETTNTVSVSESAIETKQKAIIAANTTNVCTFYVPEVIYLTPSSSNMSTFQYYVDRNNSKDGALRTGENTSGNVYLEVPGATSVSISCSGASVTMGTTAGTNSIATTITSGSLSTAIAQNTTTQIEWTATYVINGKTYTSTAYTTVYAPLCQASSTAAATIANKFKRSGSGGDRFLTTTYWLTGGHSVSNRSGSTYDCSNGSKTSNFGSAYDPPLIDSSITTGGSDTSNSSSTCNLPAAIPSGSGVTFLQITDSNNADFSGYGGTLNINVDTSRYTNYSQIPNMRIGYDVNYSKRSGYQETGQQYMWIDYSTAGHYSSGVYKSMLASAGKYITNDYSGTRQYNLHLEGPIQGNGTTYDFGSHVEVRKDSGDGSRWLKNLNHVYLYTTTVNKSALRTAINNEVSVGRQMGWYTEASWKTYKNALKEAYESLGNPTKTDASTAKTKLDNAIAGLVKDTGVLTATHVSTTGKVLGTESEAYTFGDTTSAGSNTYTGYTYASGEHNFFDGEDFIAAAGSKTGANVSSVAWDASAKKLTFVSGASGADNYTIMPENESMYFIHVKPGTQYKMTYTATGTTSQVFVFHEKDMMTRTSGTWYNSNYSTGNQTITGTVPADANYICFRFGNTTASSTTTFTNIKLALEGNSIPLPVSGGASSETIENNIYKSSDYTFVYTPNNYNVTYNPDGGTFNGETGSKTYTGIATYDADFTVGSVTNGGSAAAAPTRAGYTFAGWESSIGGTVYNNGGKIEPWQYDSNTVIFTAKWTPITYKITFDGNGATSGAVNPINNIKYDETVTLTQNNFEKTNYTFDGWNTKADGTGTSYTDQQEVHNLTTTDDAEIILYAKWKIKTYTFDLNGTLDGTSGGNLGSYATAVIKVNGSVHASGNGVTDFYQNLAYGASYEVTYTPTAGHYYDGLASGSAPLTGTITGNTSVNLKFNTEQYNIYFNYNYSGAGNYKEFTNQKYNTTISVPVPSRQGYTFGGWYKESGCTNQMYNESITSMTVGDLGNNNASVTYYAKWTANTINYAYNANGGSGSMTDGSFSYGSSFIAAANGFTAPATKVVTLDPDGGTVSSTTVNSTYTFSKWNTKADGTGTNVTPGDSVNASTFGIYSGTGTLYAQWIQNGAALPVPVKTGYTFNGWYTAPNGGGTKRENGYKPTASETLYASWSVGEYTLSLYAYGNSIANTGTYTSGVGGTVSGAGTYTYEQAISISATPATGYKLDGWYTDSTFATPAGTLPTKMPGEHKTFVAKFSIVYCTVKAYAYSTSNGTSWANNTTGGTVKVAAGTTGTAGATSEGKVITGNSATVTATPAAGYHFVGWYDSATVSGSTSVISNPLTVAFTSEGATINKYARFDINQNTLTVNPDGGSVTIGGTAYTATKSFTQNGGTTLSIAVPTKAGYTFAGWSKSPSTLSGTLSSTTAAATYTFASNVFGQTDTITATWTPNSYSIKFNANAATATGSMSDLPMTYGTAKNLTAVGFTNTGYTFAGWATSSTGAVVYADKASVNNLTTTPNGTVQLYAKWTINKYTITLHPMTEAVNGTFSESTTGGTVAGGGTYDYNTSLSITATANTGYTFAGWFSNSGMTTSATAPTKATANTELWAKFILNQYEVRVSALANTAAATGTFNATNASNAGCTVSTSAATAKHGTSVTLTATAGAGYTFVGWYDNEACTGSAVGSTPTITANKTFYAKFTVKTSTVNVYAYSNATGSYAQNTTGGTVKVEGVSPAITAAQSITMGYKGSYKVTATPATGYTFDGWFTDAALTAAATGATASDTYTATFTKKDATENLYAKFTISTPKVTVYAYSNAAGSTNYNNNTTGGTVKIASGAANASATANVNYGSKVNITATPATGYTFDGWYSAVTGGNNGAVITAWNTRFSTSATVETESVTQARTYYAKFTAKSINVTFNTAGGSITSGNATATAYYGSALTLPTVTRQGYKLLGWDENSAATTATYTASTIGATEGVNTWVLAGTDKTLYAIWEPFNYTIYLAAASDTANNIGTYIVGTNGSSTGGSIAYKSGITKINVGDDILSCLDIQVNPGYELVDVKYKVVSSAPSAGSNVTTWSDANSVHTTGFDKMVEFPDNSKIAFIAYFRVCQYTATAHAYSNNAAPYTAYANNAIGGTVKLGETGAAGKEAMGSAYSGDTNGVTFYATVKAGYTFDGWFNNEACTGTALSTNTTYKVVFNGSDVDLYAKFSINTYKAYARAKYYTDGADEATGAGYNGINGGTATVSVGTTSQTTTDINAVYVEAKYHEIVTYTAAPATGYNFAGWYKCDDASDDVDIEDAIAEEVDTTYSVFINGEDIRYHAKFVPVNFILVLNPNGGTGSAAVSGSVAEVTLTYGQGVELDENAKPTRASYSFVGWAETSTATNPDYNHSNTTCTISAETVNNWYINQLMTDSTDTEKQYHEIYAVWTIATYTVMLDDQGGTGGQGQVTVTLNQPMPTLDNIPTYDGYKFKGYYLEPDGADESGKYYSADGTSAQNWNIADGKTLYAKWVCPVLMDAEYDETTGKWTYIYEDTTGNEVSADPTDAILTKDGLTENAPDTAMELSKSDKAKPGYVKDKVEETKDINLNHYTREALEELLKDVMATNDDSKRSKLSQIQLNEYVAKIANFMELAVSGNKKSETVKPSINLYETKSKIKSIKSETLTKDLSVIGENYAKPSSNESGTYLYNDKYCYYTKEAVDYYIYTNSLTPVIAIEIDDGVVGTTVENNNSSYPTNAVISADCKSSVVTNKDNSYMNSAVAATDNLSDAWFTRYTDANIGINTDYNAKQVLYLTPTFTNSDTLSTTNEIVYTITPTDDAAIPNEGTTASEIAQIPEAQKNSFTALNTKEETGESITVCVCYHNAMNGTSDKGGELEEGYFQMYIDQVDADNQYYDTWLEQMHLFRQSGGANNWEIVLADEAVYPVEDETFKDTGYVLGSFAYVFDASNEPVAAAYASTDLEAAEKAIISSIKDKVTECQAAIIDRGNSNNINGNKTGLGFFSLGGWSTNFYPAQGSYVYAHVVDRWGNYFNKVWKCFNVDDYTPFITGKASIGYNIFEDGGSNLSAITIKSDDIKFITDLDSTYEDGVFTTTENTFTISTGKPSTKLRMSFIDNAGNELVADVKTDTNGNMKFIVDDACADISSGAYTFMLNDQEVNLYAGDPGLIREASMPGSVFCDEDTTVTVKTADRATKVQLVENGATLTYYKGYDKANVVDNGDGTLTWTLSVENLAKGEHTFAIRGRDNSGWHDSSFTVKTNSIERPVYVENALLAVSGAKVAIGEKAAIKVETLAGTEKVQLVYSTGATKTVVRSSEIETTEDGTEIWTINVASYSEAGEYTVSVVAKNEGSWQTDNAMDATINVYKKVVVRNAEIYAVNIVNENVKPNEKATIEVLTNAETTKIQYTVAAGGAKTYTSANAQVDKNEDGTLLWTFDISLYNTGSNDVTLKARSASGWTDSAVYGTVTVAK